MINPLINNPYAQLWFCATEATLLTLLDMNDEIASFWGIA